MDRTRKQMEQQNGREERCSLFFLPLIAERAVGMEMNVKFLGGGKAPLSYFLLCGCRRSSEEITSWDLRMIGRIKGKELWWWNSDEDWRKEKHEYFCSTFHRSGLGRQWTIEKMQFLCAKILLKVTPRCRHFTKLEPICRHFAETRSCSTRGCNFQCLNFLLAKLLEQNLKVLAYHVLEIANLPRNVLVCSCVYLGINR